MKQGTLFETEFIDFSHAKVYTTLVIIPWVCSWLHIFIQECLAYIQFLRLPWPSGLRDYYVSILHNVHVRHGDENPICSCTLAVGRKINLKLDAGFVQTIDQSRVFHVETTSNAVYQMKSCGWNPGLRFKHESELLQHAGYQKRTQEGIRPRHNRLYSIPIPLAGRHGNTQTNNLLKRDDWNLSKSA